MRHFIFAFLLILVACDQHQEKLNRIGTSNQYDTITQKNISDSIEKLKIHLKFGVKARLLDSLFKAKFKSGFNGNVIVAQQGQIIYKGSFGFSDIKKRVKLSIYSEFQLGSSSKPLTAMAILMLKEKGLISLSQTVDELLPNFPYKGITIKQLLTHRSGLPNYMYFCDSLYCCHDIPLSNDKLLELMIQKHPGCYYPPNRKFEYCNTNYSLLVNIVEKVTHQKFGQFMHDNIFEPLHMNHTWVSNVDSNRLHPLKTVGHKANAQKYEDDYLDGILGDKNIFTTVDDLFKFDQSLYTHLIISDKSLTEAYTGASHEHPGKRNYGYGWRMTESDNGTKIIYHNGWWHGYNNVFFRRIKDRTTIIILSNKITSGVYNVDKIIEILDGKSKIKITEDDDK